MAIKHVQYLCNECKKTQMVVFSPEMQEQYIPKDLNGLSLYSHIHSCTNGVLGVNNLYIDHNLDVRSYSYVKLPEMVKQQPTLGMPVPGAPKVVKPDNSYKELKITQFYKKNDLKIVIYNDYANTMLNFGNIDMTKEGPRHTITSKMGLVSLKYFYSDIRYTSQLERWLELFINTFELLPAVRLGMIIEVFRFIIDEIKHFPSDFDANIIKTILVSHEIYFEVLEEDIDTEFLKEAYDEEGEIMQQVLKIIDTEPMAALHEYCLKLNKEIVYMIYIFLLLEKHGLILIHRPGILNFEGE